MKLGILGSGNIVNECCQAIDSIDEIQICAICVRPQSLNKGQDLSSRFGIPEVFTDYTDFLSQADMDMLYIGVTNELHFAFAKEALLAGRHVICEKPFTSNLEQLSELIAIAEQRELLLCEAITLLHFPNFHYLKSRISDLGDIKLVQCNYSQYSSRYDAYRQGNVLPAFDPQRCGGALYDINVYNVHFVVALLGRPLRVRYLANKGFNGIDTSGTLILEYETTLAVCSGAKDSASNSFALIQGTDGFMALDSPPNTCTSVHVRIGNSAEAETRRLNLQDAPHRMHYELKTFVRWFHAMEVHECREYLAHSLDVMWVLQQARIDAGIIFPGDQLPC